MGAHSIRRDRRPFLRLRALIAGGVVLGLGVTATLASWNDSDYEAASFSTSVFDIESSVQGAAYADNASAPGPTVTFSGAGFSPGVTGYIQVLVRTKVNSVAGTIALGAATAGGTDAATLFPAFTYRVVRTTATCNATAFIGSPTWVVGSGVLNRALSLGQETGVTNTLAAATTVAPGAVTGFCFEVLLPNTAVSTLQGKTATATWQFVATSS
jgi:predicted ribosomally synthesized peptide with SipW-like signal peptide